MATLDIILLVCFIPGIIRGISKGFLEQALALVGIVLSVWAAFRFSGLVATWIKPYVDFSETTVNVIAFALILVAMSLLVLLIAKLLTKVVELAMLGWVDKLLGLVLALAVNALVIGVFIILFDPVNLKFNLVKPETLDGSIVYTTLRDLSYLVFPFLKSCFVKQSHGAHPPDRNFHRPAGRRPGGGRRRDGLPRMRGTPHAGRPHGPARQGNPG